MATPFVGEVRSFAFNYEPAGWLECNGQLLPIPEYQALFAVIGPAYGGNGETDFALPNIPPLESTAPAIGLKWRIAVAGDIAPHS